MYVSNVLYEYNKTDTTVFCFIIVPIIAFICDSRYGLLTDVLLK